MNMQLSKTPIGLDGIPAAETVLSHVDGERGELIIAGERVGDLARKTGFEGVTARLWSGGTGQPVGEAAVRAALGRDANAPSPGCRICSASRAACRSSTVSRGDRGLRAEAGCA
jgi:citrate synthase